MSERRVFQRQPQCLRRLGPLPFGWRMRSEHRILLQPKCARRHDVPRRHLLHRHMLEHADGPEQLRQLWHQLPIGHTYVLCGFLSFNMQPEDLCSTERGVRTRFRRMRPNTQLRNVQRPELLQRRVQELADRQQQLRCLRNAVFARLHLQLGHLHRQLPARRHQQQLQVPGRVQRHDLLRRFFDKFLYTPRNQQQLAVHLRSWLPACLRSIRSRILRGNPAGSSTCRFRRPE